MKDRIETICARIFVETVKFLAAFIALMAVVLVGLVIYKLSSPKFEVEDYEIVDYMISDGSDNNTFNTLWQIGAEHKTEDDDVRDWIKEVIKLNGGVGTLRPGQHINIYTAK